MAGQDKKQTSNILEETIKKLEDEMEVLNNGCGVITHTIGKNIIYQNPENGTVVYFQHARWSDSADSHRVRYSEEYYRLLVGTPDGFQDVTLKDLPYNLFKNFLNIRYCVKENDKAIAIETQQGIDKGIGVFKKNEIRKYTR